MPEKTERQMKIAQMKENVLGFKKPRKPEPWIIEAVFNERGEFSATATLIKAHAEMRRHLRLAGQSLNLVINQ